VGARARLHGRRKGRRLSPHRQRLLAALLPRLEVTLGDRETLDPRTLFGESPRPVWLEVGFGRGEHLAHQAGLHPELGLIGCEPYVNGVANLLALVDGQGLRNVRIFPGDARVLLDRLTEASLARVAVLFPDPWPKERHRKRRVLRPATLDVIARVLEDGGVLRFATDDGPYLTDVLASVLAHPAFDWPARSAAAWRRPQDLGPPSRCEAKALGAGRRPVYLEVVRKGRA